MASYVFGIALITIGICCGYGLFNHHLKYRQYVDLVAWAILSITQTVCGVLMIVHPIDIKL